MWPDIAGMREAKKTMARRLAAEGYAVLVVNQYYHSASAHYRSPARFQMLAGARFNNSPTAALFPR
jgi:dienelactone hydrolase